MPSLAVNWIHHLIPVCMVLKEVAAWTLPSFAEIIKETIADCLRAQR